MYHDRLMNDGKALDWGICGVGMHAGGPADEGGTERTGWPVHAGRQAQRRDLPSRESSARSSITCSPPTTRGGRREDGSRVHPHRLADRDRGRLQHRPRHRRVRHVEPVVVDDLRPGEPPRTSFGFVTEALRRRADRGLTPFTVMSCDNLQGNGDLAKRVFTAFARLRDPELADWIDREVSFPNSMVDRITPVTSDADRALVRDQFRHRRPMAGCLRAVHAVGARGRVQLPAGPRTRTPASRSSMT